MTRRHSLHIRWRGVDFRYGSLMLLCFLLALAFADMSDGGVAEGTTDAATMREQMVENTVVTRGVSDPLVLGALRTVPRERFVRADDVALAYQDAALPFAPDRYVWPASTLAVELESLGLKRGARVLVLGGGTGYETAVLAAMGARVHVVESDAALAAAGAARVDAVDGLPRVSWKAAPLAEGWPQGGPYDAIVALTVQPSVSRRWVEQLAPGGVLLVAVGDDPAVGRLLRVGADARETAVDVLALAPPRDGHVVPAMEHPAR